VHRTNLLLADIIQSEIILPRVDEPNLTAGTQKEIVEHRMNELQKKKVSSIIKIVL
jgi:hypothetical protein